MYRIAIVEDSPKYTIQMKEFLERYQKETGAAFQIETYSNGLSFLEGYKTDRDLVLMDIEMPHLSGIETARQLREIDREIGLIFVTYNGFPDEKKSQERGDRAAVLRPGQPRAHHLQRDVPAGAGGNCTKAEEEGQDYRAISSVYWLSLLL